MSCKLKIINKYKYHFFVNLQKATLKSCHTVWSVSSCSFCPFALPPGNPYQQEELSSFRCVASACPWHFEQPWSFLKLFFTITFTPLPINLPSSETTALVLGLMKTTTCPPSATILFLASFAPSTKNSMPLRGPLDLLECCCLYYVKKFLTINTSWFHIFSNCITLAQTQEHLHSAEGNVAYQA